MNIKIITKALSLLFLIINIFILSACGNNPNNKQNSTQDNPGYNIEKTSSIQNETPTNQDQNKQVESKPQETTASEFSTKILTKSKNRATNIKITCEKINGMEVKPGETFSFCDR